VNGPRPLSLKEISLFFFPLLLNVQLMSVSHSVINAALARQQEFVISLAAFSVALTLQLFISSPSYQNHTVTIAMVRGRKSMKGTLIFVVLVAIYVSTMLALIGYTRIGNFVFETIIGVRGEVAEEAKAVIRITIFLPFFSGFRGFFQGLVIRARRTGLVSFATGVRIAALFIILAQGRHFFSGAALGGFGLLGCIMVESALMGFFAWRAHLPATGEPEKGTKEILQYAFPLAYSSCLQQSVPLTINAIISRLPDGALALAAFGVIRGFIFLLSGPMRNLQQAYLTLVRDAADYRLLLTFFWRVGAGMSILTLLIAYPLNGAVLGGIMGLNDEMRNYIALPLAVCAIFPIIYGASNLLRGWFSISHRTGQLGRSTIFRFFYLLAWWAVISLFPVPVSGVAISVFLLISSEFFEAFYLRRQRAHELAAEGLLPGGPPQG